MADEPQSDAGNPVQTTREAELRAEIDRLRLEKQQLIAGRISTDPLAQVSHRIRQAWHAGWHAYYVARWHLVHARDPRRGLRPRDTHAPYHARLRQPALPHRPRVLHVVGNFYTGGSARLIVDLVEYLGHRFDQRVLVRSLPPSPAYTGIELIHRPRLWSSRQVEAVLRQVQPDFVHVHMLGHQMDDYGRRDWRWYHRVFAALERCGRPVIENLNIPVEPYVSPVVRTYVHVSNYVRDQFGRLDAWNETIYPGSDVDFFTRPADAPRVDDTIGMIYRLQPDKLDEESIEPFIRAVQRRPATKAVIVGGGQFLEHYKRRVAAAGVESAFTFTGYVPYAELRDYLARMSIFVAPVHTESFGQVSPFAMGMSLPVVGYRVGALEEITGAPELLAPPGDADRLAQIIVDLLDDPVRRDAIGRRNRQRAEDLFSLRRMIARYEALYDEILQQPGPSALTRTPPPAAPAVRGATPQVSVVMAVFNGEKYLREAISSVLSQTFRNFELVIVDDGSTDRSAEIVRSYRDPRIRLLENGRNLGLSRSLNLGIAHARGRYIARLDADDIAEPERLEEQVRFLQRNPDVVVVGCQYRFIDERGHTLGRRWVPCTDLEIRWMLEFCTPFAHSAVMMRRRALEEEPGPYDESLTYAMDYDLWTRLAGRGRLANLEDVLLRWRMSPGSMTSRMGDRTERLDRVVREMASRLGWSPGDAVENQRRGDLLCSIVAGATPDVAIDEAVTASRMLFALHEDFCVRHRLDADTSRPLRTSLRRETARVLLWMGHQYPDTRRRVDAVRALAAAGRQHPSSLLTANALGLVVKIVGGPLTVSTLRRLGNRSATAG